ncbi:hypothetical protein A2Z00_05360 [Candidatus Gottesmanbacteria bacterium RBG_13_45_10]|uniref:Glycosyltransferase 2-like domain-containing protein n=1 Tax=Candidatus Gottesmanbacteria bacterium RBG_13_45_10 TaxID=1798370 RepID=A0A1F5ZHE8_9BACT|nr:MAG: hypothetical protein A2Z00_05360 [Candidatus Gottesmanbacteria bacterium RBG_13_45_10]
MNTPHVSVIICTKNRAKDLAECLRSLKKQTVAIDEIIIINNLSTDETPDVLMHYKKQFKNRLHWVRERRAAYPIVYNRGLKEARCDWVAFIDDDCVASPNWYAAIKKSVVSFRHPAAILGATRPCHPQNAYSLATYIFHTEWKENNSAGDAIVNLEILDNKNIVYHRRFLRRHHLAYDENRKNILHGAGEDADLGLQIQQAGGKAMYNRKILVYHKEPETMRHYWRKYFCSLAAYEYFKTKWANFHVLPGARIHFRNLAGNIANEYNYSFIKKIQLFTLLYTTVIISIFLHYFLRFPGMTEYFISAVDSYEKRT